MGAGCECSLCTSVGRVGGVHETQKQKEVRLAVTSHAACMFLPDAETDMGRNFLRVQAEKRAPGGGGRGA